MSGGFYEWLLCSPHSNQAGCLPLRAFPNRPFHEQSGVSTHREGANR
jgi:hypothetical protein